MTPLAPGGRKAAIAFILVTAALDVVALGIVIPVLPVLIEEFTGSNARAGVINGLFVAAALVMPPRSAPRGSAGRRCCARARELRQRRSSSRPARIPLMRRAA